MHRGAGNDDERANLTHSPQSRALDRESACNFLHYLAAPSPSWARLAFVMHINFNMLKMERNCIIPRFAYGREGKIPNTCVCLCEISFLSTFKPLDDIDCLIAKNISI